MDKLCCDKCNELTHRRVSRQSIEFRGYVLTFNKREDKLSKLPLNSSFCAITADSKSRSPHDKNPPVFPRCPYLRLPGPPDREVSWTPSAPTQLTAQPALSRPPRCTLHGLWSLAAVKNTDGPETRFSRVLLYFTRVCSADLHQPTVCGTMTE